MESAITRLGQRIRENFTAQALDLDVHLQSIDAVFGPNHFEVHGLEVHHQDVGKMV